jgi:ADP-ribosylglycohydrolase
MKEDSVRAALFGVAVGDALGVPYEFRPRYEFDHAPATGMAGYGAWNQPPGTWSDDSSLTFCLAETLVGGYDLADLAARLVAWADKGYWTARGAVFDIGRSTSMAIDRLRAGTALPADAGLRRERDNGNGSLMRILPAAFYVAGKPADERAWIVAELSSLTHGHRRAQLACVIYVEWALRLLDGLSVADSYRAVCEFISVRYAAEPEKAYFDRFLSGGLGRLPRHDVLSSGYVVDTLEAAGWCLLNAKDFRSAVLAAVNLGSDTDTVAAVTGGLAGLAFGYASIPSEWLEALARRSDIDDLASRLAAAVVDRQPAPVA